MGADPLSGPGFDPAACDRIPIQIPGLIQPHGALLVLRPDDLVVVQASANTRRWLGAEPDAVLGRAVDDLFGTEVADRLRATVARERLDAGPRFALTLVPPTGGAPLDVTVHTSDGLLVLELEATGRSDPGAGDPYTLVRDAVARLQSSASVRGFCQTVAVEVRRLTGFDRVMVYRFAADASGWVLAEDRRPDAASYLDKHFPAGDVPKPARDLMARNWLRLVPDVGYEPVPLVPVDNPVTGRPLDMSFCLLRHSSRMCTTYLKNMGTACQMTMPLLRDGALWGLVSCHHAEPRFVPFAVRAACEVFAQVASLQVAAAEDREAYGTRIDLTAARERLLAGLDRADDPAAWLLDNAPALAAHLPADGSAVCTGHTIVLHGRTPTEAEARALGAWLGAAHPDRVFASDCLSAAYPPATGFVERAAGLLAVEFGPELAASVLWFRREEVETVAWAGDPRKPVETGPLGEYLSPRRSFERWLETVRGKCRPWSPAEVEATNMLRAAVLDRVRTRTDQAERVRSELAASRKELDAFVYVASHDLKEPVRGIHGYAHYLIEQAGAKLDTEERRRLDGLVRLTDRMEGLIESLLHFSRVGQLDLTLAAADLSGVAAEALDVVAPRIAEAGAEVVIGPLPTLRCDRRWVREVLVNLITNGLKYNDQPHKRVEIGYTVPTAEGDPPVLFVRDNGIGIPERHREAVFQMFKRLHGRTDYGGGTGAGLAIVRKIVDRHGGRIWAESVPGAGSTFYFTLATEKCPK
ncbi:ATP-binding protein [Frigoriglobus tundricola]|uniref:histidine kinase n=1 Tax=Frigoriglobus tundricola TaxID=2774151 RepID=A0A6M5YI25_9BACT|nr:ATP-binding protein [Frigoriglobus tundricola]QJW92960.1 Phytochrome, two-component sensor histidine kinase [Frigoriglobus tundricola]